METLRGTWCGRKGWSGEIILWKLWFSQSFINCGPCLILSALCLRVPSIIWECRPDQSWSLLIYWRLSQTHIPISLSPRARPSIPCVSVSLSHHFHFTVSGKHPQGSACTCYSHYIHVYLTLYMFFTSYAFYHTVVEHCHCVSRKTSFTCNSQRSDTSPTK